MSVCGYRESICDRLGFDCEEAVVSCDVRVASLKDMTSVGWKASLRTLVPKYCGQLK